jgi:hypothetical protein
MVCCCAALASDNWGYRATRSESMEQIQCADLAMSGQMGDPEQCEERCKQKIHAWVARKEEMHRARAQVCT